MPITAEATLMFTEAAQAGAVTRRQRAENADALAALGKRLRNDPPRAVVTLARGSSDCAATFGRYLIERRAGVLTSSASPSIASVYDAAPDMADTLVLAISQSGQSPDLCTAAQRAKAQGATILALVNDEASPLARDADICLPLHAGPERSVAATKSFIASLTAILDLIAVWTGDAALARALDALPDQLESAWQCDWTPALPILEKARSLYVAGRGHGFGIAQEAALKFKETCGIHAEAYSAAEIRHGPMAIVGEHFPVLMFGQDDASLDSIADLARDFTERGADVLRAGVPGTGGTVLPVVAADPLTTPVLTIASFYRMVNALAVRRGLDPDSPPHLRKVTETV
tara:strand:+ start:339 stop:1373 length:1035 start_codon:yes stop_codon:yes gene_type:complete